MKAIKPSLTRLSGKIDRQYLYFLWLLIVLGLLALGAGAPTGGGTLPPVF